MSGRVLARQTADAIADAIRRDGYAVATGLLVHRGGAYRGSTGTRLGITPQYCEPWVRQIENMALAVPPEIARRYSERIQELCGYFEPTFLGYVDGMHPKRLLDPTYAARGDEAKFVLPCV